MLKVMTVYYYTDTAINICVTDLSMEASRIGVVQVQFYRCAHEFHIRVSSCPA